jgi:ABC-type sugar transport system permease subunit
MLPAILLISFVVIIPFISSVLISFTDYNGFDPNFKLVGLTNFIELFKDNLIIGDLLNTVQFTAIIVFFQNIFALLLALALFNLKLKYLTTFFRATIFLPSIIATVAVAFIWNSLLNPQLGWVVGAAKVLGVGWFEGLNVFGDPNTALAGISFVNIWQWTGWSMVVYFAGLQLIPLQLIEASHIDGAGAFRRFFNITIPMLAPSFTINLVMTTMGSLKIFDLPYVITGGGPVRSTETLTMLINNTAFKENRMGYASAIALLLFVFIMLISILQVKYFRKAEDNIT